MQQDQSTQEVCARTSWIACVRLWHIVLFGARQHIGLHGAQYLAWRLQQRGCSLGALRC